MARKKSSSKTWIIVHIVYPLVPFLLEGLIRFGASGFDFARLRLDTFSASSLAMSIGLLCLFVNQSLLTTKRPLSDEEEREAIYGDATMFLVYAIFSFALFAVLTLLSALAVEASAAPRIQKSLTWFSVLTFLASIFPIRFALAAQRSYKLKASL
jgi:hypothetical protein